MNSQNSLKFGTVLFVLSLLLGSCGEPPPPPKDEEITTDTASTAAKVALDQIFVNIPPPMELTKELAKAGFNYNRGILNSSSKGSGYSSNLKGASNLGGFVADLSYTTAYGQTQDALGYLNAIKQLADKVNVGAAFDATMIKRFEGNIANQDTLEAIINDAFDKANRNLRSNQRISTAGIVSAGGWIESLYISCKALEGAVKDEKTEAAFQRVWSQMYAYQYVVELLTLYEKNPDCAQMLKDILVFKEVFDIYSRQVTVGPEEVKAIGEKIAQIRNSMVG